jgi:phage recombination protein Bet
MSENQEQYEIEASPLGRIVITEAQVELIKNTVAKGATNDELKLFFYECRRRGVHPLDRLIHFVKRGQGENAKAVFQAGIDFLRGQAEETGQYRGQDSPEFGPVVQGTSFPSSATVTVRRKDPETGEVYPVSAIAFWEEYYPGDGGMGFMWRKMPRGQLSKCAEALALRKAFPRAIAGLYSFEEMEQADMIEPGPPKGKPAVTTPQSKSAPAPTDKGDPRLISEAQRKRFYAKAKGAGKTDEEIKSQVYVATGQESTKLIPVDQYEALVAWAEAEAGRPPEQGPEPQDGMFDA